MCARILLILLGILLLGVGTGNALAEKRVALVIGNSAYRHAPKLPNPSNDAGAVSILLKSAGFEVVETRENLGVNDMRRAIRDFSDKTRDADIAVVFYAGHGIEVGGNNYLVPVDAALERDIDVEDETVSLERLLTVLEPAKRLRLVILDACRENPFARSMKRTMVSRTIGRGLARVEPTTSDTLIAFAAKAGSTAADGDSIHSPFTAALLKHIAVPGLDLRIAFGRVRDEVLKNTGNKQEPFVYGSLGGTIVALISQPTDPSSAGVGTPSLDAANAQAWRDYDEAAKVRTQGGWDSFLAAHPKGFYADLARVQRDKLNVPKPAAPPPTKVTAVPPAAQSEPEERSKRVAPPAAVRTKMKQKQSGSFGTSCAEQKRWVRTVMRNTGGDQNRMTMPAATLQAFARVRQNCGGS